MATQRSSRNRRDGTFSSGARRDTLVRATKCLKRVFDGQTIETALASLPSSKDRALIFDICYGTVRHWFSLSERISPLLHNPIDRLDTEVRLLLLSSAYQLQFTRVKSHALVSESVHAVRLLGFESASGFVNAVLRRYDQTRTLTSEVARFESPEWLIEEVRKSYPDHWQFILQNSLTRAPVTLRVNRSVIKPNAYHAKLHAAQIKFKPGPYRDTITLSRQVPQTNVPGFDRGEVSIQDAHSQIAANLLNLEAGLRVLDACAAPGIKTLQMLDIQPDIELTSIDNNARRSRWLERQPRHLRGQHSITIADATNLDWWDRQPFDRILLDAPCTSTGTLRRHPDIKLHRAHSDVERAQTLQKSLINSLWETLAPEGLFLYCTCSVLSTENHEVVRSHVDARTDVEVLPVNIPDGIPSTWGRQLLPVRNGGDGFFYSLLRHPR